MQFSENLAENYAGATCGLASNSENLGVIHVMSPQLVLFSGVSVVVIPIPFPFPWGLLLPRNYSGACRRGSKTNAKK